MHSFHDDANTPLSRFAPQPSRLNLMPHTCTELQSTHATLPTTQRETSRRKVCVFAPPTRGPRRWVGARVVLRRTVALPVGRSSNSRSRNRRELIRSVHGRVARHHLHVCWARSPVPSRRGNKAVRQRTVLNLRRLGRRRGQPTTAR